jgi:predicted nucleotidyltransferase
MTTAPDLDTLALRPPVRAALREAKAGLERLYGDRLVRVVLFGSQARGDAHDESDVDVLVVLRGDYSVYEEIKRTSSIVMGASLRHQVALSFVHFSAAEYDSLYHPLMMNIRQEGIEL